MPKSATRRREHRRKGQPILLEVCHLVGSALSQTLTLRDANVMLEVSVSAAREGLCAEAAGPHYLCWLCCWPLSEGQSRQLGAVARFVIVCQSVSSLCDPSCWVRDSICCIPLAFLLHWSKGIWHKSRGSQSSLCIRKSLTEWLLVLSPCLLFGKQDQSFTCFLFPGKTDF